MKSKLLNRGYVIKKDKYNPYEFENTKLYLQYI